MRAVISCFILIVLLIQEGITYATQINVSSATTSTISNFYQDFSFCSCDRTPSLCDNYCCCDSACSAATVTSWTSSYSCITTSSTIQYLCNQSSSSSYSSFNDLFCVYFTNRGSIGYFYQNIQASTLTSPSVNKFSSISPNTIGQSFQSAVSTAALANGYTKSNQYLLASASTYYLAPQPGPGGFCIGRPLNATNSKTSSCYITPSAANCATLNSNYAGVICLKGDCSSNYSLGITATSAGPSSCSSVLTGLTITYSIGMNGTEYVLSNVAAIPKYAPVNYGQIKIVNLAVAVTSPASNSGNPGYQLGKTITISPPIAAIADPTTGACSTTSSGASLDLLFGQSAIYSCASASPCSNSYYIDSLIKSVISLQKYASQSTDTVTVSGTFSSANSCANQAYNLQIVYSYDGWSLDPQYYILGAALSAKTSPNSSTVPSTKYLSISWVFTDPSTVSSPPSNLFYTYFGYLWTPLKQKFGLN